MQIKSIPLLRHYLYQNTKFTIMRKNLLTLTLLAVSLSAGAQIVTVNDAALFYVSPSALVYNGVSVQTLASGTYDVRGNIMIEGPSSYQFNTLTTLGGAGKTNGGNFILRLNDPTNAETSTYGQLYINGLSQANITGIVDKEYRAKKQGTYQQIALPFQNKLLSSLSGSAGSIGTFGKTFTNARYSQDEILNWNNDAVVSDNRSVNSNTTQGTTYFMLGSKNLDSDLPPSTMQRNAIGTVGALYTPATADLVYTIKGVPYEDAVSETLFHTGAQINFGVGGNNLNSYNEKYKSYLQDQFQKTTTGSWGVDYGQNIYQFGNPFLTNLDLFNIARVEAGTPGDGNNLTKIWGIRYDPGTVTSLSNGSTYSVGAKTVTYATNIAGTGDGLPVGDKEYIIKPMQTFVIKMRDNTSATLLFNSLRRFNYSVRAGATSYTVDAGKGQNNGTIKQLATIALDSNGKEIGRTYYVVSPTFTTGHQSNSSKSVQAGTSGANVVGTFEENASTGGYDQNYLNYLLYINEANENDFEGKAIPLAIYNSDAKKLRFEILENGEAINDGVHNLSTGIGFFYKASNGDITEIKQHDEIAVTSDEYGLYYGKNDTVLSAGQTKANRTIVVYSAVEGNYVVQFDPQWKNADVKVYDMSGKVVINQSKVNTKSNFVIKLSDQRRSTYVVAIESESGEKVNTKIIK